MKFLLDTAQIVIILLVLSWIVYEVIERFFKPEEEEYDEDLEELDRHNKNLVRDILLAIGENPDREGLLDTPRRVVKSWKQIFAGYGQKVEDILTVFDSEGYDEMVLLKDIEFYSNCEHHIQPFFGKAHVAYVPDKKIVGISKLARVVDIFAKRLQNQERLTGQIAEAIQTALKPRGVAVVLEAQHFCMKCRGVGKQNSIMKTASITGVFRKNASARAEFYDLIK